MRVRVISDATCGPYEIELTNIRQLADALYVNGGAVRIESDEIRLFRRVVERGDEHEETVEDFLERISEGEE